MALKAIMLRHKIEDAKKELDALREKDAEFATREAELEAAIAEATTDEESAVLEADIDAFENSRTAHRDSVAELENKIRSLEESLSAEEQNTPPAKAETKTDETRKDDTIMNKRNIFAKMDYAERSAMFARDDVKNFLSEVRTAMREKRSLSNAGLLIPHVFLGLIRENIENYSKLYKHVFVRQIGGEGNVVVMGAIPEAVWTECCANINELDFSFYNAEVGCNKVAGFVPVCNALLEDSDIDLAAELVTALGQSIGLALDKAILYGTGVKMPQGVMARLAQTAEPESYPANARPWADLHTANIKSHAASVKGVDLFAAIVTDSGAAKGKYSRGEKVWVMNETTYTNLLANALSINAAGAITSGVGGTMPVAGGVIEVLNFIPDNVIIGGYFDCYLLAERASIRVDVSEHARFVEDFTLFRGKARYDGLPVIAEAFVAIGINGVTPAATMTFAADTANT